MSTPVTIAILNYQRRDALRRALEAARGQRYAPLEILAVDNASTDGSQEMVRDEFPDVHLVALPANIAAAARNEGVRAAKGEKNGLTATWCGAEALDDFYGVFAVNMRDLGSPVHSRAFFRLMLEELPGTARVLVVRDGGGRAVGAAVCLFFRDTIMVPWVSSLREAFALCPNFVLYWEVIRYGCENGYRTLDLGRSFKNAGTHEFKRQWGAVDHTLPWISIDTVPGAAPPVDRDASRFAPMIAAWKRLPVPVANLVGPWIRGQVPN